MSARFTGFLANVLPVLAPLAMMAVALLSWFGNHHRLREYGA